MSTRVTTIKQGFSATVMVQIEAQPGKFISQSELFMQNYDVVHDHLFGVYD